MALIFPHPKNVTNFWKQLTYINSLTDVNGAGGMIGLIIEILVFFGIFLLTKAYTFERSFATSMLVTSFVTILLRIMGLVNDMVLYLTLILFVISIYFLWNASDGF